MHGFPAAPEPIPPSLVFAHRSLSGQTTLTQDVTLQGETVIARLGMADGEVTHALARKSSPTHQRTCLPTYHCAQPFARTRTHARTRTRAHARARTYARTHAHAYARTRLDVRDHTDRIPRARAGESSRTKTRARTRNRAITRIRLQILAPTALDVARRFGCICMYRLLRVVPAAITLHSVTRASFRRTTRKQIFDFRHSWCSTKICGGRITVLPTFTLSTKCRMPTQRRNIPLLVTSDSDDLSCQPPFADLVELHRSHHLERRRAHDRLLVRAHAPPNRRRGTCHAL
eukprot:5688626-Pleurochrysis_carterae.AAC.2